MLAPAFDGNSRRHSALQPGERSWSQAIAFIASMSAVIAVGAYPVLTEVDESLTMDPLDAEGKITPRTRVIMPVTCWGQSLRHGAHPVPAEKYHFARHRRLLPGAGRQLSRAQAGSYGALGRLLVEQRTRSSTAANGAAGNQRPGFLRARLCLSRTRDIFPYAKGIEIGNRTLIGINMRYERGSRSVFALGN